MRTLTITLLIALAGVASGADRSPAKTDSTVAIPEPLQEYYYGGLAPEKLAYSIDLWYDAALKGDKGKVARCEETIRELLGADLDSTRQALSRFGRRLDESQKAEVAVDSTRVESGVYSEEFCSARDAYALNWDCYLAKERLARAIEVTSAYSNKYRLMSDYIEVLRRQVGLPKLKYAAGQIKAAAQGILPPGSAN